MEFKFIFLKVCQIIQSKVWSMCFKTPTAKRLTRILTLFAAALEIIFSKLESESSEVDGFLLRRFLALGGSGF